jgi:hypothetical protein
VVVNALDGTIVELTLPTKDSIILANQAHLLVGADGKTYLLAGHVVIQWTQTSQGFNLVQSADWNYRGAGMNQNSGLPIDAGVTPQGDIWLFYSGFYGGTSIYWLDPTGKILADYSAPFSQSTQLVAIDGQNTAYICGMAIYGEQSESTVCEAYPKDSSAPVWNFTSPVGIYGFVGAAMAPGRLYVITQEGSLTAYGDSGSPPPAPTVTP